MKPNPNTAPIKETRAQHSKRILFADDDEDLRILLATHLRKFGYEVREFVDGESLLEYVGALMLGKASGVLSTDQILLDVKMPGFNGLQVLASLRLAGWVNPIILLTAMRGDVADQALRLGATGLIQKPFDADEVTNLVARIGQFSEAPPSIPRVGDLAGHLGHLCM